MPIKKPPRNAGFLGGLLIGMAAEAERERLIGYSVPGSECTRCSGDTAVWALYSEA